MTRRKHEPNRPTPRRLKRGQPRGRTKDQEVEIEKVTERQIRDWKKAGKAYTNLQLRVYEELVHQRYLIQDRLLGCLVRNASERFPFHAWQRIVALQWSADPLSVKGSLLNHPGGRFNFGEINDLRFPRFGALYIAEDRATAVSEYYGTADSDAGLTPLEFALVDPNSIAIVSISGEIDSYIDLTKPETLKEFVSLTKHFKLSAHLAKLAQQLDMHPFQVIKSPTLLLKTLLDPNWRAVAAMADIPANSQIFGQLVMAAGIEAILFPSVRGEARCLAVYPQNFQNTESFLQIDPPVPPFVKVARIDARTLVSK